MAAPATRRSAAALGAVHAFRHPGATAALAVRQTGPAGGLQRVKPTLAYPALQRFAQVKPSVAQRRDAAARADARLRGPGSPGGLRGGHVRWREAPQLRAEPAG